MQKNYLPVPHLSQKSGSGRTIFLYMPQLYVEKNILYMPCIVPHTVCMSREIILILVYLG